MPVVSPPNDVTHKFSALKVKRENCSQVITPQVENKQTNKQTNKKKEKIQDNKAIRVLVLS